MGRIYVSCWDGVCFDLMRPWMDQGLLPNLRDLVAQGASGPLTTVFPPVTATAWSSFATGVNPAKHGILDMTLLRRNDGFSEEAASGNGMFGRPIWSYLGERGGQSIILSLPPTYPPRPIDGVLVSDFLAPKDARDLTWPPELLGELEDQFGPYRLHFREVYSPSRVKEVIEEAEEVLEYSMQVAEHLVRTKEWDLAIQHIFGTDRLQHELWHVIDPDHPSHRPEEAKWADRVVGFFQKVDAILPRIREWVGEDGHVLVASDHGFGPVHHYLVFNCWLLQEGFLQLKRGPVSRIRAAAFRAGITPETVYKAVAALGFSHVRQSGGMGTRHHLIARISRFFLSFGDVDWSRTIAYSKGNYGQIYLNVRGREPDGVVEPGADYEARRDEIMDRLRKLREPGTDTPLIGRIWRREELYEGPALEDAPDILFLPRDMKWKALGTMDFVSNRFVLPSYSQSGDHRMDGVVVMAGPAIKPGTELEGAQITDVAPTLMHLLGHPVPNAMDGNVLQEAFTAEHRDANPVREEEYDASQHIHLDVSEDDRQRMTQQLKDLGYLG